MDGEMLFRDRREAGRRVGELVVEHRDEVGPDPIVLALPRGGVPVGFEVARALGAPLDIFVVRKVGVPGREELAMGAAASGGVVVLNRDLIESLAIPDEIVDEKVEAAQRELERRERLYRIGPPPSLAGRGAILVDDGLATGATMFAAIRALRKLAPARTAVAVPVAAWQTCREVAAEVDLMVCADTPEPFWGIGGWYEDFSQTTDDEVRRLLELARTEPPHAAAP